MRQHNDDVRALCTIVFATSLGALGCGRVNFDAADVSAETADARRAQPLSCSLGIDDDTVALYTFDADGDESITDALGGNPGVIVGALEHGVGPSEECGDSLQFDGDTGDYVVIADSSDWVLSQGAVDFWFQVLELPGERHALISKDASGTDESGHITVFVEGDGRLMVRVQEPGAVNEVGTACSNPGAIEPGVWNHVGINFGSLQVTEAWLNGERVDEPGILDGLTCQTAAITSLDNREPLVFGMTSWTSEPGELEPVEGSFSGAIDAVRISSANRDFSDAAFGAR